MKASQPFLLVDDDDVDVMTVRRAFQELKLPNPLHRVADGEQALAFLRDPANPRPGVILLDLKMPRMGGIEFLKEREEDAALKRIPVVVLTTSDAPVDRNACFSQCISGYMVKPVDYPQFVKILKIVRAYWDASAMPEE
jgi:CheY-like chemotaxis protein